MCTYITCLVVTSTQNIQIHRYTYIQIYRYTDIQIYRYTDIQIYRYTDTQIYRYTYIHIYRYTDTQIYRYTDIQIKHRHSHGMSLPTEVERLLSLSMASIRPKIFGQLVWYLFCSISSCPKIIVCFQIALNTKVSKTHMKLNWFLVPRVSCGRCSDSICSGRYGDRNFPSHPHRPRGQPSLLYNGYRLFPGGKTAGALC
jgi:hypothetical protein